MATRASYIIAGALLRGNVRNYLKRVEFSNPTMEFRWIETKTFFESRFDFRGDSRVIDLIEKTFNAWVQSMNEERARA